MVFAYGSGVFGQGYEDKSKLIDLLVVVSDVEAFHRANLRSHASHYPRWLQNADRVSWLQRTGAAHMVFFPYVTLDGKACKYGVIGEDDLIRDLRTWDTLYCAGRLHKPVRVLRAASGASDLHDALQENLSSAIGASMVLLAASGKIVASERDVFAQIARLSYDGDVRMMIAENPRKIDNIVSNNLAEFDRLYRSRLDALLNDGTLAWGRAVKLQNSTLLPARLASLNATQLRAELARTVRFSSASQTLKNVLSAGFGKSIRYALRKGWK
jgi:translocator assembly and maintenance protein 41